MDIREQLNDVVDAFIKVEKINHIKSEIRTKQNDINNLPTKCGSCSLWMTSDCQREKRVKVSNNMPICNSFQKAFWIDNTIQKWQSEISELELSLNGL